MALSAIDLLVCVGACDIGYLSRRPVVSRTPISPVQQGEDEPVWIGPDFSGCAAKQAPLLNLSIV